MNSCCAIRLSRPSAALALIAVLVFVFGSASAAPIITATKDDNLAAGLRKVPGNTITYTITIGNSGDATATSVLFTDPDPANTTFVSVNSTPLARNDTYAAIGNVQISIAAPGVLANDNDPDGVGPALTVSASPATTTGGGNLSVAANGSFTYNPAPGFTGADTFTYTISDGEGNNDTATVTINVTGTIWFINAAAGAGGDGRLTAPFNTVAAYVGSAPVKDPGDNIFLYTGTYSTGLTLLANQRLIGQGALSSLQTITGLTPPTGSLALPATGGTRPTIAATSGTGVILGSGNTVNGLNVTNSNGSGITGSGVGTLVLADFDVTVTGGAALSVTTSGTITATGVNNNLNSTTGAALNVASVTIGGAGMTFRSISAGNNTAAADPASGIILNGTGAGGLTVTGDGGASNNGSGGTIQNTTGVGVSLTTTGPISFGYLNVANSGTDGIKGATIGGFTLNRCNVTDTANGGGDDEGVELTNVSGAVAFTNDSITGATHNGIEIDNFNTNMASFSMTGTTINGTLATALGNDGILLVMRGTSVLPSGVISGCTFIGMRAVAAQIQAGDTGRIGVNNGAATVTALDASNSFVVQSNTFTGNGIGVDIDSSQVSNVTFQVLSNTITAKVTSPGAIPNQSSSHAINAFSAAGAATGPATHAFVGKIDGNIIGTQGVKDSGSGIGSGIRAVVQGQTTQGVVTINNNTIREVPNATLITVFGQNGNAATGTATARFKITNNTMPAPSGSNLSLCGPANSPCGENGIFVLADESTTVSTVITGNTIFDLSAFGFGIYLAERAGPPVGAQLRVEGTGSVSAFILANNTLAGASKFLDEGANTSLIAPGSVGGYPLLLAPGGVDAAKSTAAAVAPVGGDAANVPASGSIEIPNCPCGCKARLREAMTVARAAEQAQLRDTPASAVSQSELDVIVSSATERWSTTGLSAEQLATLQSMKFEVADLPGWYLGEAGGDRIRVDRDAGGNGWFIGGSPTDDSRFANVISATRRYTDPAGAPAGRIDLLTTILHEMGHALGLDDSYLESDRDSLMYGFLTKGERRLPAKGQAAGAVPHAEAHPHFLGTPLTIGDLPPGKTVTITYVVTINPTAATSISSQGTVSGSNIANKVTNDPQTGAADDATITPIQQPPVVGNVAVVTNEDTTLAFTAANFTGSYTDPNTDALTTVRITSLPANGVLKLGVATIGSVPTDIAIGSIGTLTFVPAADFNGATSFGWNGSDGTLFALAAATVNITVNAVNDKPSFTAANPPTVNEDAGPQTVAGWATFNPGAANEAGQTVLAYAVSSVSNAALFSAGPAVATNGTLTYTPAPNANGTSTFQVRVQDNGGTALGGIDTSDPQTFTITVIALNDAPVITGQFAVSTTENTARTIIFGDLIVTDVDNTYPTGFTLTVSNGANYTRAGNTITPALGFVGTLSVPVQVNDGAANSNIFNLAVTVNPTDAHAAVSGNIVPEPGGGFRISFLGNPGATYTIQFTDSLVPLPTAWQFLGTRTADANAMFSIVDIPPANTPIRFYRAVRPYLNNFNAGLGTATLRGTAVLSGGAVKLTDEVTGGFGAVVFDGITTSPALSGFTARFSLALGPISFGIPADGASFAVGDLGPGVWGETGPGATQNLAVGFDTFNNGSPDGNIGIHVWVNGTHLTVNATDPYTNGTLVPVEISYDVLNGLTVKYNGATIFNNLAIPGFAFPVGGKFGVGARTGGFSERAVVDDIEITPR